MNISFCDLRFDLFLIIVKQVNQIRNNVVCVAAHLVFMFCCGLTTGHCNAFQHNFVNEKKSEFYGPCFQTMLFLVTMMEYIEINWLRKYMNKVRSSQAYISVDSCTELSKEQFYLWVPLRDLTLMSNRSGYWPKCYLGFCKYLETRFSKWSQIWWKRLNFFSIIVKPLNREHLQLLKNSSVIKKWPLLGVSLTKIVIFGTKRFLCYARHVHYLGCPLFRGFTAYWIHLVQNIHLLQYYYTNNYTIIMKSQSLK